MAPDSKTSGETVRTQETRQIRQTNRSEQKLKSHLWRLQKDNAINCTIVWWNDEEFTKTYIHGSLLLHPTDNFNMFLPFLPWIWLCPPANLHLLVQGSCQKDSDTVPKILGETDSTNQHENLMVVNKQRKCYGSWPCSESQVNYCLPKS